MSVNRVVRALAVMVVALLIGGCSAGVGSGESVDSVTGALCSGLVLTPSPASPQPVGAQVTITASGVTCDAGETAEYAFYYLDSAGTYTLFRDFAASNSAVWDTTGLASGTYNIYVLVRPATGGATSSAYLTSGYSIGSVCDTTTSFNFSPSSPQPSGTTISLSATATCGGSAVPEFRYAYYADSGALTFINAGYSTAPVPWNTAGLLGPRTLLVFTRAVGNNNSTAESTRYGAFTLGTVSTTCSSVSVTPSPAAPQPAGTLVTFTGSASPCSFPQFIYYYRLFGGTTWNLLRDYGPPAVTWDTTGLSSGSYEILAGAHNAGNTGGADVYTQFTYAIGSSCGSVTLSAAPASPQPQGTPVLLTGVGTCGTGSPEYSFYYQPTSSTTRTLIRTWGPSTVTWDTSLLPAGTYALAVFVRAVGNTSAFDSFTEIGYTLSAANISQVDTGFGYHSCTVLSSTGVKCFGQNTSGQLGDGSLTSSSTGVMVSGLANVVAVATGNTHSCAVLSDMTVRCWGDGSLGQLGNGGTASSTTPVVVTGLSDATAISAGMNHTCVLRTGGAVSCWGYNANGQLGSTSFPQATTPVAVATVSGASAIAAGGFHTCALVGGAVSCWGDNSSGQLGIGATPTQSFTAVTVAGLSGVTSLSGGEQSTCAVVSGAVQCWGDNTYGQLGDGSKTNASVPVSVTGLSTAVQVSAGHTFACARLSSGAVNCWGRNDEGELGNGSAAESLTPTAVSNITSATTLSVGGLQACVMLSAGGTQCWGYNGFGQLGDGTTTDAHVPVSVQ